MFSLQNLGSTLSSYGKPLANAVSPLLGALAPVAGGALGGYFGGAGGAAIGSQMGSAFGNWLNPAQQGGGAHEVMSATQASPYQNLNRAMSQTGERLGSIAGQNLFPQGGSGGGPNFGFGLETLGGVLGRRGAQEVQKMFPQQFSMQSPGPNPMYQGPTQGGQQHAPYGGGMQNPMGAQSPLGPQSMQFPQAGGSAQASNFGPQSPNFGQYSAYASQMAPFIASSLMNQQSQMPNPMQQGMQQAPMQLPPQTAGQRGGFGLQMRQNLGYPMPQQNMSGGALSGGTAPVYPGMGGSQAYPGMSSPNEMARYAHGGRVSRRDLRDVMSMLPMIEKMGEQQGSYGQQGLQPQLYNYGA